MSVRRRDDRQQQPEQVRRRSAPPPVDARVARVLMLQRNAGNHAVASALRARTLQRLTLAQVKKLTGDEKTNYEAAKAKYDQNFAVGKPLYDYHSLEPEGWNYYLRGAETVDGLVQTINKLLVAATAWKKEEDARAAAPATPALAVPPSPKTQTTEPTPSRPRKQAAKPATDIVFGAKPYFAPPGPAAPQAATVTGLPPKLDYVQRSLDNWNGTVHTGNDGRQLTLEDVQKVVSYVTAKWAAKPFKGPGSGAYRETGQLKISELGKVGSKSATWHLTLSPDVYAKLGVPEAGSL